MGQYQQWLHFREVDRHLQAQLEELVRELAQLHERTHLYEQVLQPHPQSQLTSENAHAEESIPAHIDNAILHALAIGMNGHVSSNGHVVEESTTVAPLSRSEIIPNEPGSTISPALFAQSNLPNFETPFTPPVPVDVSLADTTPFPSYLNQPLPPIPHYDMALLPEDMTSFFDQHTTTDPQMELPWWLRNLANVTNGTGPIDQESIRTNRLVQRWLERWGKQPQPPQQSQQSQLLSQPPPSQKSGGNQS